MTLFDKQNINIIESRNYKILHFIKSGKNGRSLDEIQDFINTKLFTDNNNENVKYFTTVQYLRGNPFHTQNVRGLLEDFCEQTSNGNYKVVSPIAPPFYTPKHQKLSEIYKIREKNQMKNGLNLIK